MLWQVRALMEDRPGALAALAAGCGDQLVNILGLQIFPAASGRVVDELVLHTPGGWTAQDIEQLFALAGVDEADVTECSPHALEDQPTRYLRAAQVVTEEPALLEDQLGRLLGAFPSDGIPGLDTLELSDGEGPEVRLSRSVPFTDTEIARATELRRVAAVPGAASAPAEPGGAAELTVRLGTPEDAGALVAMHARCSSETVSRRYHAPLPRLSPRLARALLRPPGGLSLVMTVGEDIMAIGMLAPDPSADEAAEAEIGLMVEDRWQRQGHGTRLLRELVLEGARRGLETVTCQVEPANDAVLHTLRRADLRARVSVADGLTQYRVSLRDVSETPAEARRRSNRPAMGEVTTPLVALLHGRQDLRGVYQAADLIDQAVRGGA
ncbi:MAG TPA: GNAT family N-acetyltransferase [Nocardioidaceae bacterium]|nr:GNAT family N-acetyltransferase [Nocardioidaceae bacterium]